MFRSRIMHFMGGLDAVSTDLEIVYSHTAHNLHCRATKILSAKECIVPFEKNRFISNRTGDVFAATLCKTELICVGSRLTELSLAEKH